ncbi:MAG: hypothetical protein QOJ15_8166 [Bradyrhizobium sp.]|jgi:hypothetical protein|nr:hypothetical protein [Bradyrhizobium sp.]
MDYAGEGWSMSRVKERTEIPSISAALDSLMRPSVSARKHIRAH